MAKSKEPPYSPFDCTAFSIVTRDRHKRLVLCCQQPGFTHELLLQALKLSQTGIAPVIVKGDGFRQKVYPDDNVMDLCRIIQRRVEKRAFAALRANLRQSLRTNPSFADAPLNLNDEDDLAPPRRRPHAAHGGAVRATFVSYQSLDE